MCPSNSVHIARCTHLHIVLRVSHCTIARSLQVSRCTVVVYTMHVFTQLQTDTHATICAVSASESRSCQYVSKYPIECAQEVNRIHIQSVANVSNFNRRRRLLDWWSIYIYIQTMIMYVWVQSSTTSSMCIGIWGQQQRAKKEICFRTRTTAHSFMYCTYWWYYFAQVYAPTI